MLTTLPVRNSIRNSNVRTYNILQFLSKLNSDRASEEESLIEVAIALSAVDRLLGNNEGKSSTGPEGSDGKVCRSSNWYMFNSQLICV